MDFSKLQGLVPAVIQHDASNEVLMVGFMNDEALRRTRDTGYATFFSRSRNQLWTKGETSGNRLEVVSMLTDCDDDTVLVRVRRLGDGNVCHTGQRTCFFRRVDEVDNPQSAIRPSASSGRNEPVEGRNPQSRETQP